MNRYSKIDNLIEIRKKYFISRIERIISLMEQRNEVYLFENQNIFRHPTIFEKISKVPSALKILNNKEKQWLKKDKKDIVKIDNIYIYIADTLAELYNNFPTNKNIKRAINICLEILAIKIMLNPIYKERQKNDLINLQKLLATTNFKTEEELLKIMGFEKKLNPELYKFIKNWTRSITFDLKVKFASVFIELKAKIKKEKRGLTEGFTRHDGILLSREEIFENISERLFECSMDNMWLEEFKFMSARIINKCPLSYSKVLLKKRVFENNEQIKDFEDKIEYLLSFNNTYLSADYKKYSMLFPKGVVYGLQKFKEMRGMDYNTARLFLDILLINSIRQSHDDAYRLYNNIDNNFDAVTLLYGYKPYRYIKFRLQSIAPYNHKEEHLIIHHEELIDFIINTVKFHFTSEKEIQKKLGILSKYYEEVSLDNFFDMFEQYIQEYPKIKKEILSIFKKVLVQFEKDFIGKNKYKITEDNQKVLLLKLNEFITKG